MVVTLVVFIICALAHYAWLCVGALGEARDEKERMTE
jgi:hypothetical protein